MNYKHTEGNWIAKKNDFYCDILLEGQFDNPNGKKLCATVNLLYGIDYSSLGTSEENAANAQLMASSPRLLEMLVSCVDLLEGLDVPDEAMETFGNLIMNARQTIIDATNPDLCKI